MSEEPLVLGEPDVIRKEDNILWLRAEIERLQSRIETLTAAHAQDFDDLQDSNKLGWNTAERLAIKNVRLQSRIELLESQNQQTVDDYEKRIWESLDEMLKRIELLEVVYDAADDILDELLDVCMPAPQKVIALNKALIAAAENNDPNLRESCGG